MDKNNKPRIIVKYLISCIVYSTISHVVMNVAYPNLNYLESSVRSLVVYTVNFSAYAAIPVIISLLIAKLPKSNRNKPVTEFYNIGLIIGWIIALIALFFGWYGLHRAGV